MNNNSLRANIKHIMDLQIQGMLPLHACLLSIAAVLGAGVTEAQEMNASLDNDQAKSFLEEVVVTARRRDEILQEIPIAVSAIDTGELERRNYSRTADLQTTIPSLSLTTPFGEIGTLEPKVRLRGLEGVAVYFSEVPSFLFGSSVFTDLQSVQVARGPQGTLFGKNAIGGAILFQPNKPENEFLGYIKSGVGNYGHRSAEVMVNMPIIDDKLAIRVNAVGEKDDGYTKVLQPRYRLDNKNHHYERISIYWTPVDSISNNFIADNYFSNGNGPSNILDVIRPDGFVAQVFGSSAFNSEELQRELGPRTAQGGIEKPLLKTHAYRAINNFEWNIEDGLNLKVISSYQIIKGATRLDLDGTALPLVSYETPRDKWASNQKIYTNEVQLSGQSYSDKLDWVVGTFYSREKPNGEIHDRVVSFGVGDVNKSEVDRKSIGLYLQGTYAVTNSLNVTAGYRYSEDSTQDTSIRLSDAGACQVVGVTAGGACERVLKGEWDASGWTLGVDYTTANDHLIYMRSGRAYNEGTFNRNSPTPEFYYVDPEYFTDIELGHKFDWALGSVAGRSSLAFYYGVFEDVQHGVNATFIDAAGNQRLGGFTTNAADASVYGAEYSLIVALTESLRVATNITYNVAKFDSFKTIDSQGNPVDYSGQSFTFFPKWKYDISVIYDLLSSQKYGDLQFSIDYFWSDKTSVIVDIVPSPTGIRSSYDTLNVRLDWSNMLASSFSSSLVISNATDTLYREGSVDVWPTAGFISQKYAPPRMWELELKYQF